MTKKGRGGQDRIQKPVKIRRKCVEVGGDYVENSLWPVVNKG